MSEISFNKRAKVALLLKLYSPEFKLFSTNYTPALHCTLKIQIQSLNSRVLGYVNFEKSRIGKGLFAMILSHEIFSLFDIFSQIILKA